MQELRNYTYPARTITHPFKYTKKRQCPPKEKIGEPFIKVLKVPQRLPDYGNSSLLARNHPAY